MIQMKISQTSNLILMLSIPPASNLTKFPQTQTATIFQLVQKEMNMWC